MISTVVIKDIDVKGLRLSKQFFQSLIYGSSLSVEDAEKLSEVISLIDTIQAQAEGIKICQLKKRYFNKCIMFRYRFNSKGNFQISILYLWFNSDFKKFLF